MRVAAVVGLAMILFSCGPKAAVKKTPAEAPPPSESKQITALQTYEDRQTVSVRVMGNRDLTFTAVKQNVPPGVILYFPETRLVLEETGTPGPADNSVVTEIKTAEMSGEPPTSRLEILLNRDLPYEVARKGTGLEVIFQKPSETIPAAEEDQALPPAKSTAAADPGALGTPVEETPVPPAGKAKHLQSVYAKKFDEGVRITVQADGTVEEYQTFSLPDPPRIVVDIPGLQSPYDRERLLSVNSPWVEAVRHYGHADKLRLVLDTQETYLSAYKASPTAHGLDILVGKNADPKEPLPQPSADRPAWVNRVDFASEAEGKSTVIVGTTHPVDYDVRKEAENQVVLELRQTHLPAYRHRPLVTTRFESAVDRILPVQTPGMKSRSRTRIAIDLREAVPYRVEQVEDLIFVHFDASSVPPRPMQAAGLPDWQQAFAEQLEVSETAASETPTEWAQASEAMPEEFISEDQLESLQEEGLENLGILQALSLQRQKVAGKYHGEKIALDFYNTDIKNVFRILREISGENFAVDKDVTGKVNLSFEYPVPWDQILDLVLKMNQLGRTFEGDVIRIATLDTLKREEKEREAKLEARQKSKRQEDHVTAFIPISYTSAVDIAAKHIAPLLTATEDDDQNGKVSVDERLNTIIVTDVPMVVEKAKEIAARLDQVTAQVVIEARIVEADSTFSREFGVKWGAGYGNQNPNAVYNVSDALTQAAAQEMENLVGANLLAPVNGPSRPGFNTAMNFGNLSTLNDSSIGINFVRLQGTPLVLDAKLLAEETEGVLKIVSTPKVVTLDNKTATIMQGLEYPYNKLDENGNTVVEWQEIALKLEVTPHVTPDNRITMLIKIEKKDLGSVINAQQSFTTKEAETELLVNDGDTVVIGGIIKSTEQDSETGFPLLKDIPFLGHAFKSSIKAENKEELLIFITPKILKLEQRVGFETS